MSERPDSGLSSGDPLGGSGTTETPPHDSGLPGYTSAPPPGAGGPVSPAFGQAPALGGRYVLANVVPTCRSCNASKCNTEVTSWMRRKKLDERRFLVRHVEINRQLAIHTSPDDVENDVTAPSQG